MANIALDFEKITFEFAYDTELGCMYGLRLHSFLINIGASFDDVSLTKQDIKEQHKQGNHIFGAGDATRCARDGLE